MSDRVYRVTDETDEEYWVGDPHTIYETFGRVLEVVQFDLMNPLDITDQINGDYWDQQSNLLAVKRCLTAFFLLLYSLIGESYVYKTCR